MNFYFYPLYTVKPHYQEAQFYNFLSLFYLSIFYEQKEHEILLNNFHNKEPNEHLNYMF